MPVAVFPIPRVLVTRPESYSTGFSTVCLQVIDHIFLATTLFYFVLSLYKATVHPGARLQRCANVTVLCEFHPL